MTSWEALALLLERHGVTVSDVALILSRRYAGSAHHTSNPDSALRLHTLANSLYDLSQEESK